MNAHQEARDREKLEKLHDRLCRPRINGAPLKPLYPEVVIILKQKRKEKEVTLDVNK